MWADASMPPIRSWAGPARSADRVLAHAPKSADCLLTVGRGQRLLACRAPKSDDRREAGQPLLEDRAVGGLSLELAQHADRAQRHPVDQQVGRRQVELAAELVGR